ncbi:hypothetical protein FRX31_007736 [Thalictrum thalictroides]|uniref:Uncharacterized protein n=1 Tax=Thalictrum thalictroides TaxID=46969 RepID=A0A7J6X0U9_THATH|nr:hypothetical protein FRX31_007736 [Thalictrum thalictroides]
MERVRCSILDFYNTPAMLCLQFIFNINWLSESRHLYEISRPSDICFYYIKAKWLRLIVYVITWEKKPSKLCLSYDMDSLVSAYTIKMDGAICCLVDNKPNLRSCVIH